MSEVDVLLLDVELIVVVVVVVVRLPLETMKSKIAENLDELEKLGVVSAADGYQHIINCIAQVCQCIIKTYH